MESVTALVGAAIGKAVFRAWFRDNEFLSALGEGLTDVIAKAIPESRARNAAQRQLSRVSERSCDMLEETIRFEWNHVSEDDVRAAANAVSYAIDSMMITPRLLAEKEFDASLIGNEILKSEEMKYVPQAASGVALALVQKSSELIVDLAGSMPEFHRETLGEILRRESSIMNAFDRVFEEIESIKRQSLGNSGQAESSRFEQTYRRAAARQLDRIELFGLDSAGARQSSREHALTTAYISLSVTGYSSPEEISSHTQERQAEINSAAMVTMTAEQAAAVAPRIVIKGEAGSGKTTLLQSLAVRSATGSFSDEMSSWNEFVPFFVRLRAITGDCLPPPEAFPSLLVPNIAGAMPNGWVHELLRSGRAVLLIDGVDEISDIRKDAARRWLKDIVAEYPDCRVIVTSRPPAIPDGWLGKLGFAELELLPMSPEDVGLFIEHWHIAVEGEESEDERRQEVRALVAPLKERIRSDRALRELAATPLLCAMLCAMNRDRRQVLPSNKIALYDAAAQMLLHGRDDQRKVRIEDLPALPFEAKSLLLQEAAFWMMQNELSMGEIWRLEKVIQGILPNLTQISSELSPDLVVKGLIHRSGVLRSPVDGKFDFIHNAFKEYFCAKAISHGDRFGFLQTVLSNEAWREVAVLATAITDARRRGEFIHQLLEQGDRAGASRPMYHLLAVSCLEACNELSASQQQQIKDRLTGLQPPINISQAKAVSSAGELAFPLLSKSGRQYATTAAACVRALRLIGTPGAMDLIGGYADDKRATVVKELLAAWSFFDRVEYAKSVLSRSSGFDGYIYVSDPAAVEAVGYLSKITNLVVYLRGSVLSEEQYAAISMLPHVGSLSVTASGVLDLSKLSNILDLRALLVRADDILNLSHLGNSTLLQSLSLSSKSGIRLTPEVIPDSLVQLSVGGPIEVFPSVSAKNVRYMSIGAINKAGRREFLGSLRNVTNLLLNAREGMSYTYDIANAQELTLLVIAHADGLIDLSDFPYFSKLKTLSLANAFSLKSITETKLPSLERLEIRGAQNLASIQGVPSLSALREFSLRGPTEEIDLSPLLDLPSLEVVDVPPPLAGKLKALGITANLAPLRHIVARPRPV